MVEEKMAFSIGYVIFLLIICTMDESEYFLESPLSLKVTVKMKIATTFSR